MNQKLKEKIKESLSSVLPITIIVLMISIIVIPMDIGTIALFFIGALLLIVGMGFFQLGAEMALTPLGEGIGVQFSKTKKIGLVVIIGFFMGFIITVAEPDLQVLADQVPSIPSNTLIYAVAAGVGIFLITAILRILFKINLSRMLLVFYLLLFLLSFFAPNEFIAVSFDSGGVTTGPITVPFIMALGVGLASVRSDKDASDDSFGLVALCSIGPITAVLLLSIFYNPSEAIYELPEISTIETTRDLMKEFIIELPHYFREVFASVVPLVAVFLIFSLVTRRFKRNQMIRMSVGYGYTFIGLVLFLSGANIGFMPVGSLLGSQLATSNTKWLLIPIGMLIGYFIVAAEPAVQVLNRQVEDVTDESISRKAMNLCLSIGVSVSVGLSMLRVLTGISIYWIIIPGYAIALLLTFFVPKIFVGIAFDSGGVASGPMTSTFLLPFAMGACESLGGNVMTDAFGVVAMVAMTPLIAVQIMGLVYKFRLTKVEKEAALAVAVIEEDEIIDYEEDAVDE